LNFSESQKKWTGLFLGPVLFILFLFFIEPQGMSAEARAVLASTLWVATWWITEAIPIPATSLLPIILLPLAGGLDVKTATSAYGDKMLFLFIGAFMIALAMEKWNLHKRIALNIILAVGTNTRKIILGFMIATGFLSMWISNTATTMMMMPIGVAIISQFSSFLKNNHSKRASDNFGKALMLGIAYSASIGGLSTLIGTPTNPIFAAMVKQIFNQEISFADWMMLGTPLAVVLIGISWIHLVRFAFPLKSDPVKGVKDTMENDLKQLGSLSWEEKWVMVVFVGAALAWISRSYVLNLFMPALDDTIIAVAGALILFFIPTKSKPNSRILNWETAVKLPWGVILLFGGGLSIAAGFKESGLAQWIGTSMTLLQGLELIVIIAGVTTLVNFLTEITSNVATATIILPILASIAASINIHPYVLMVAATIAASCAFMLPVATAPNAIVFGTGYVNMQDMIKAGFWLNILSIIIIILTIYFLLSPMWGIDMQNFPQDFR